ncbi:hypothetical protein J8273_8793 [Carpediemonas membranifera]|uniref:Uncharacterized protein n=1 Tax=Carpediemonas membranifera TaxID=201153 RepID=A0A8J6DYS3_9EUKA|nr:hypothetical protein J8273_8793 [Carpediemonas membranifera]|eukprot:KAG9389501.1 hypothetical protein J8273_8793 [Carpediemonas membranifera]
MAWPMKLEPNSTRQKRLMGARFVAIAAHLLLLFANLERLIANASNEVSSIIAVSTSLILVILELLLTMFLVTSFHPVPPLVCSILHIIAVAYLYLSPTRNLDYNAFWQHLIFLILPAFLVEVISLITITSLSDLIPTLVTTLTPAQRPPEQAGAYPTVTGDDSKVPMLAAEGSEGGSDHEQEEDDVQEADGF